jgi:serine/threonine protein kinase
MEKLLLLNARAVEHSRSHRQARFYYEWAKAVPSSITRGIFTDVTGFTLDGAHDHLLGFLFAFDKAGAVLMFKITPDSASEVEYAKALYGGPFLVPAAFHKVELEGHKVSGLLMPKYERSLAVDVFNLSLDILYSRAKTMEQAVAFIHSKGIVHMDIKPGNIFIDSAGNWYLGDFGSCTLEGSTILSTTEVYYPRRIIGTPSKFAYDWYMLCAAVVSKIKTWEYEDLDASVRGTIAECIHPQLKLCLETFMDRHDKGL